MKTFRTLCTALFSVSLIAVSGLAQTIDRPLAKPGEFIVELNSKLSPASLMQLGAEVTEARPVASSRYLWVNTDSSLSQPELMAKIASSPIVKRIEPNYFYYTSSTDTVPEIQTPNDIRYTDLWGLKHKSAEPGLYDMDAERAWALSTGSAEIVVSVIDTGVDYTHEDLKDNMWVNEAERNGVAAIDDDGNGYVDDIYGYDAFNSDGDPMDDQGHGTHVSGTIGASGNNGLGVVGVNWKVKIMAVKAFDASGAATSESILNAVTYAHKMNARVLSNSWGGFMGSAILRDLIAETEANNQIFVAASGNNGFHTDLRSYFPSGYNLSNVISVGATNDKGLVASFSNYGSLSVDIYAPGEDILSTMPGNKYGSNSGTSMATPHVSGLAALILSLEPELTAAEVKERIMMTSLPMQDSGRDEYLPRLANAYRALKNLRDGFEDHPSTWTQLDIGVATSHPYAPGTVQEWTIVVPGATELALFVSELQTERDFDSVKVYDKNDGLVLTMGGFDIWGGHYTPVIPGDTVRIVFESDKDIEFFGFEIPYLAYSGMLTGEPQVQKVR